MEGSVGAWVDGGGVGGERREGVDGKGEEEIGGGKEKDGQHAVAVAVAVAD